MTARKDCKEYIQPLMLKKHPEENSANYLTAEQIKISATAKEQSMSTKYTKNDSYNNAHSYGVLF